MKGHSPTYSSKKVDSSTGIGRLSGKNWPNSASYKIAIGKLAEFGQFLPLKRPIPVIQDSDGGIGPFSLPFSMHLSDLPLKNIDTRRLSRCETGHTVHSCHMRQM